MEMIKVVSETIRGIKPFFLLVIFFILSTLAYFEKELGLFANPISIYTFLIPFIGLLAYVAAWSWIFFVIRARDVLSKEDLLNFGYLLACSLMVLVVLITFSYIANNYETLSLAILIKPEFIYTCALFLMARVTFDTAGS